MARHQQWHIRGWPAFALIPIMLPVVMLFQLGVRLGLLKGTADLTSEDVVSYIENWIEGRGGEWDWDDFTSIQISDPVLESLRAEAASLRYPMDEDGEAKLRELLARARSLT
jgi:hypothetical protein